MVAGLLLASRPAIDASALKPVRRLGRAEQMVEPEAEIALPAARGIVPEGVELLLVRMYGAERVGPALMENSAPRGPRLRLHHRVPLRRPCRKDVAILRNDVPVA